MGVWVEFDPGSPHPYNADSSDDDIRDSAVPYNPSYGYAAVRQIDLTKEWYYYDPTGYYGVTPTATVQGISGYVHFTWSDDQHPYNQASSIPEEARDYPYPYGVALTNEAGEVLEWTTEGTTYDQAADSLDATAEALGLPALGETTRESSGNVFVDAWYEALDYLDDSWSFLEWLFGEDLGENPITEWLRELGGGSIGSGD